MKVIIDNFSEFDIIEIDDDYVNCHMTSIFHIFDEDMEIFSCHMDLDEHGITTNADSSTTFRTVEEFIQNVQNGNDTSICIHSLTQNSADHNSNININLIFENSILALECVDNYVFKSVIKITNPNVFVTSLEKAMQQIKVAFLAECNEALDAPHYNIICKNYQ